MISYVFMLFLFKETRALSYIFINEMGMNQVLTIYYLKIFQQFNLQWFHEKEKKRLIRSLSTLLLETIMVSVGKNGSFTCYFQEFR